MSSSARWAWECRRRGYLALQKDEGLTVFGEMEVGWVVRAVALVLASVP
jgi:hypothetical protein